jgi:hypothetical protein
LSKSISSLVICLERKAEKVKTCTCKWAVQFVQKKKKKKEKKFTVRVCSDKQCFLGPPTNFFSFLSFFCVYSSRHFIYIYLLNT